MSYELYLILFLVIAAFSVIAQILVKSTFSKYQKVANRRGMTGAEAARAVLLAAGVTDVRIGQIGGELTDHYDPKAKEIRLSDAVYGGRGISSLGVAAHEAGHAIQYAMGYGPASLRTAIVGLTQFASKWAILLLIGGLFLTYLAPQLIVVAYVGFFLYCAIALFQIVTLPVEFNASRRACAMLEQAGVLDRDELPGVRSVLRSAAMTYVAAMAASVLQVLRLASVVFGRNRR